MGIYAYSGNQANTATIIVTFQGVEHPEYLITLDRAYMEGWGNW